MDRKCDVCNAQDVEFVRCSGLSSTSYEYCRTCVESDLEPLDALISVAICSDIRTMNQLENCFSKDFLNRMLLFHKETEENLLKDIKEGLKVMDKLRYEEWK